MREFRIVYKAWLGCKYWIESRATPEASWRQADDHGFIDDVCMTYWGARFRVWQLRRKYARAGASASTKIVWEG